MYVKHIRIQNFRNFSNFETELWHNTVIVGENNAGKSNLLYALRLVLDPSLPNSARVLEDSDFWDGLDNSFAGNEIRITVVFADFENNSTEYASVPECFDSDGATSSITYVYGPKRNGDYSDLSQLTEEDYEWYFWCENTRAELKDHSFQRFIPFEVLPALRNVSSDLENNQRSPLSRLVKRLKANESKLRELSEQLDLVIKNVLEVPPIPELQSSITNRLLDMIGRLDKVDPQLGIIPTDPKRLLNYIRLFADQRQKRYVSEIGTGYSNIVYIVLLLLDFKQREQSHANEERRATTIVAVEEPEAHLHPHLQRLVFGDLFKETEDKIPIFLTTHSPHIVSISPLESIILLKKHTQGTVGTNILNSGLSRAEIDDLERYLDVTRAEVVFSSGVILVEGIAEVYLVAEFAKLLSPQQSLDVLGISVANIYGTNFAPYLKLLGTNGLNIPTAVITDGDPRAHDTGVTLYGVKRCLKLLSLMQPLDSRLDDDLHTSLEEHGLFVGSHTLEIDLVDAGYQNEFLEVFHELGWRDERLQDVQQLFDQWDAVSFVDKKKRLADKIERSVGKGRFAQRLATKLDRDRIPPYILQALRYMGIGRDDTGTIYSDS